MRGTAIAPRRRRSCDITSQALRGSAVPRKESAQITLQSIRRRRHHDGCRKGVIDYLKSVAEALRLSGSRIVRGGRSRDLRRFSRGNLRTAGKPLAVPSAAPASIKSVRPMLLHPPATQTKFYVESTALPDQRRQRRRVGACWCSTTVSEAPESIEGFFHASHDVLTGSWNRREFEHRMSAREKRPRPPRTSLRLCCLDLEQFKLYVSDTCGARDVAGDALLGQGRRAAPIKGPPGARQAGATGRRSIRILRDEVVTRRLKPAHGRTASRRRCETFKFNVGGSAALPLGASTAGCPDIPRECRRGSIPGRRQRCQAAKESRRNRVPQCEENDLDLMRRRREAALGRTACIQPHARPEGRLSQSIPPRPFCRARGHGKQAHH